MGGLTRKFFITAFQKALGEVLIGYDRKYSISHDVNALETGKYKEFGELVALAPYMVVQALIISKYLL